MNTQATTGIHLRQFINLLRRRWKLIVVAVVVAAGLAGAIGLVFPARYTATAEVIVDPPRGGNGNGDPNIAGELDDAAVQTHVAALLSQSHLQRVFDSLVVERGPGSTERGGLLGAEAFTIDNFTKRINAFKDAHSRMIGITYTSTDPAFAAAVANRSVKLYLATLTERNIADRNNVLRSLSKRVVDQQLVDLSRQLAVARSDLAVLHARPTAVSVDQATNRGQLAEESSTLETRVRRLQQRIAILQDASNEVREPEAQLRDFRRETTTFPGLYDGLVQREKAIFGEDAQPDLRILSPAGIPNLPSSLSPLLFIPPAMVLALIGAGLLALLLDQLDGTLRSERDVTDTLGIACIGVVPQPTREKKRSFPLFSSKILSAWSWTGLRQGMFKKLTNIRSRESWAGLRQGMFEKLTNAREVLFGRRHSARQSAGLRPHQLIPEDARYTEAIRSVVAAALQLANPQRTPKTLLVTSSVPREGKTSLAISFAVYAARIRRRVLLIDLSFRGPSIASELGDPADGGSLQVLHGRPATELIRAAPGLGFDYLPVSRDSEDPVAALVGEHVPKLLRELEDSYDCVVIDSAPLLSATEARLLASMVDKVLFAIKWGSTPQEVARNALGLLRGSAFEGDDLREAVTAVITQVDLEMHARYRYGDLGENLLHVTPHPA